MKYCMECGSALAKKDIDGTERLACTACSFVHWGNYSIGVGALVVRDDKVLLVRRAIEPGKGKWTNPGGYIEQLEPIEDTIVREVYEESGIRAKVQEIIAVRDLRQTSIMCTSPFAWIMWKGSRCLTEWRPMRRDFF